MNNKGSLSQEDYQIYLKSKNLLTKLRDDGYFITEEQHEKNLNYVGNVIGYLNKKISFNLKNENKCGSDEERFLNKLFLFIVYNPDLHIKEFIVKQIKLITMIMDTVFERSGNIDYDNWLIIFHQMINRIDSQNAKNSHK
jgi:hypothetical protein